MSNFEKRNLRLGHLMRPGHVTFGVIGSSFFRKCVKLLAYVIVQIGKIVGQIVKNSSRIITGSASKAEKGANFIKQTFTKKGVGKFSKNTFLESARRQLSSGMFRLF